MIGVTDMQATPPRKMSENLTQYRKRVKDWTCIVSTPSATHQFHENDDWVDVRAFELGVRAWALEVRR